MWDCGNRRWAYEVDNQGNPLTNSCGSKIPKRPSGDVIVFANQADRYHKVLPEPLRDSTIAVTVDSSDTVVIAVSNGKPAASTRLSVKELKAYCGSNPQPKCRVIDPEANGPLSDAVLESDIYHAEMQIYAESTGSTGLPLDSKMKRIGISRSKGLCSDCKDYFADLKDSNIEIGVFDGNNDLP